LDYHLGHHWGVRLAQLDFLQSNVGKKSQNNLRYSAGIIIKF